VLCACVLLGGGVFGLGVFGQLGSLIVLGFLGFCATLVALLLQHARVLYTVRESLVCAREGQPSPGTPKHKRNTRTSVRDLR
jgi:hypothetical protein